MIQKDKLLGFLCLIFLILIFTYFLNREWFKRIIIGTAVSIIAVFIVTSIVIAIRTLYFDMAIDQKNIREQVSTYENVEEVIDKYYSDFNVYILSEDNYYYIITKGVFGNKEELLVFKDNRYTSYDKILEYSEGKKPSVSKVYHTDLLSTTRFQYEIGSDQVIIFKRAKKHEFLEIYDKNGTWDYILVGNYYYYYNVSYKEECEDGYKVYASTEQRICELIDYKGDCYWLTIKYLY